ncbi:MAG: hypothetical protein J0H98_04080 [Solirubrobacterales bacterium]|nr:hypothetical protein [Solirubrobacterales bacterium]
MAETEPRRPARRKERGATKASGADAMKAGYAKSEVKNQAARDALLPLSEGERPTVVTIGAVLSGIVAAILWVSCVVALVTGAKAGGESVNVFQWGFFAAVITLMAWGMWKAKYWAVLGFQMLLVLLIMAGILGMVVAPTLLQIVSTLLLTIGLSVLFWFMVKAMARIQMPDRPGS